MLRSIVSDCPFRDSKHLPDLGVLRIWLQLFDALGDSLARLGDDTRCLRAADRRWFDICRCCLSGAVVLFGIFLGRFDICRRDLQIRFGFTAIEPEVHGNDFRRIGTSRQHHRSRRQKVRQKAGKLRQKAPIGPFGPLFGPFGPSRSRIIVWWLHPVISAIWRVENPFACNCFAVSLRSVVESAVAFETVFVSFATARKSATIVALRPSRDLGKSGGWQISANFWQISAT
jgi:hypothetical protein